MDPSTMALVALGILALVALAFFAVFRGRGGVVIRGPGVSLRAEGENPPPAAAIPAGVRINDATGQNVRALSTGAGGVQLEKINAKGDINATSSPGTPGPKQ